MEAEIISLVPESEFFNSIGQNTSFAYFMRTASYLPEAAIQLHLSIRSNTHQKYDEGKHTVVAGQIHPGAGDQRRQAGNEIQRLQHHMRGAIAVRRFELVTHPALGDN